MSRELTGVCARSSDLEAHGSSAAPGSKQKRQSHQGAHLSLRSLLTLLLCLHEGPLCVLCLQQWFLAQTRLVQLKYSLPFGSLQYNSSDAILPRVTATACYDRSGIVTVVEKPPNGDQSSSGFGSLNVEVSSGAAGVAPL